MNIVTFQNDGKEPYNLINYKPEISSINQKVYITIPRKKRMIVEIVGKDLYCDLNLTYNL